MAVLAALAAVDLVVPFDADTPRDLIVACRPDVLVKGGDYTAANTAGAAETIAARRPLRRHPVRVRSLDHRARAPDSRLRQPEDAAGAQDDGAQMSCRARARRLCAAMTIALLLLPDFLLIAGGAALKRCARLRRGLLDRARAPRLFRAVPGAACSARSRLAARRSPMPDASPRSGSRSRSRACCFRRSRSRCSGFRSRRSRRASSADSGSTRTSRWRSRAVSAASPRRRDQPADRRAGPGRQRRRRRHAGARAASRASSSSLRAIRWCLPACRHRVEGGGAAAARGRVALARAARGRRACRLGCSPSARD